MARILVIDDDQQIRDLLHSMLENDGFSCETAPEGKAGMRLLAEKSFDLVITDLIMPGKEGLETIMELRRTSPHIKIIAISGGIPGKNMDFLSAAQTLGASRVFSKPVRRNELIQAIKELLVPTESPKK